MKRYSEPWTATEPPHSVPISETESKKEEVFAIAEDNFQTRQEKLDSRKMHCYVPTVPKMRPSLQRVVKSPVGEQRRSWEGESYKLKNTEEKIDLHELESSEIAFQPQKEQSMGSFFSKSASEFLPPGNPSQLGAVPDLTFRSTIQAISPENIQLTCGTDSQGVVYTLSLEPNDSSVGAGAKLVDLIKSAAHKSFAIKLPDCNIELGELTVSKSIAFIGSPGTILTIKKGPISLKGESRTETASLSFSQVQVISPKELSQPLFEVWGGGELSFADCTIKGGCSSTNKEPAIHVCPSLPGSLGSSLKASATTFDGFFTHILCSKNSHVKAENCVFLGCSNSSIIAINPTELAVTESAFERCGQSAIEVRWRQNEMKGLGSSDSINKGGHTVSLANNNVSGVKASGIAIWGEKVSDSEKTIEPPHIDITNNTLTGCMQEGIVLKNLAFCKSVRIAENKVTASGTNGIAIVSSNAQWSQESSEAAYSIELGRNSTTESKESGIYIFDTSCKVAHCNTADNGSFGILLKRVKPVVMARETWQVVLKDCSIHDNKKSGVEIVDCASSRILIEDCAFEWNAMWGLLINNSLGDTVANASMSSSASPETNSTLVGFKKKMLSVGKVLLKCGKIQTNKFGGISVSNQCLHVDGTLIQSNGEQAIIINGAVENVTYSSETLSQKLIQGPVIIESEKLNIYHKKKTTGCCSGCIVIQLYAYY